MVDAKTLFRQLLQSLTLPESKEEKEAIIYWLLEHSLRLSRAEILTGKPVDVREHQFDEIVHRLNQHEPLQYILGETDFYGRKFLVTPAVLIPRPETELLVQHALDFLPSGSFKNVLDIGTGTGCIAITLDLEAPSARVTATDNSTAALAVARQNANSFCAEVEFLQHDILMELLPPGQLDMVVSNPPYVLESEQKTLAANVREYEPSQALFVPDTDPLLYYRAIGQKSFSSLTPKGILLTEINEHFGAKTEALFKSIGFKDTKVFKDLRGKDRFVFASKI